MRFPRTLHFIYLDEEIPLERRKCIDSCIRLHPTWDVRMWTSVSQFGLLRNRRAFMAADDIAPPPPRGNRWQIVSNILRFEVMLRHGGLFFDTDIHCLKPLDDIIERAEAEERTGVLGWEIERKWLGEAVIACEPGAPFMQRIVANLEPWAFTRKGQAATKTVGPQYITPLLLGTIEVDDVLVMPQEAFFPARHDQPELGERIIAGEVASPGTYVVHKFENFKRKRALGLR